MAADLTRCRGCTKSLIDSPEKVIAVQYGELTVGESGTPVWSVKSPTKSTWGRMHERCFLLAINDPRGVELSAEAAERAAEHT